VIKIEDSGIAAPGLWIVRPGGQAAFGMTPSGRLARQAARKGLRMAGTAAEAGIVIRGDHIYGSDVFDTLAEAAPGTVLVDGAGRALAARVDGASRAWALALLDTAAPGADLPEAATAVSAAGLAGRHNIALRKRLNPLLLPATDRDMVEKALFTDSYKGVTDLVTKHVWPQIALPLTRLCALTGVTPNQVTTVSAVLVGVAFWLFWEGHFGLGLVAAWTMTLLDTVDGKLARVTLNSSPFGNVFDHGIDLIHPPFWYWAWAAGCAATGQPLGDGGWTLGLIIAGYVLQRGEEALFLRLFGMQIHIWRRFDSLFRQVTARRNPNLLILMAAVALGAPREGLIAVAAWTVLCLLIHLARVGQALSARRAGPLTSWLAEA
jgi:phosphatidylglycerophosphate synthase